MQQLHAVAAHEKIGRAVPLEGFIASGWIPSTFDEQFISTISTGFMAQQHVPFVTQTASKGLKMSENTNDLAFLRTFLAKTESQDASLSCDFSFWDASIPIHRCSSRLPLHLVASEPWDPLHRWAKPARWPLTFTLAGETQRDGDSLGLTGAGGHWWTLAFLWFWVGIDGSPGSWFCQGMTHTHTYIYIYDDDLI
jgi:hypothetical protein